MKLRPKRKNIKMKNLLLTIGAVALTAMTINATAADTLLSPRATGNQIKQVPGAANDVNLVAANAATVSPRAVSNQIKTVAGTNNDVNPAIACAKDMNGTPKAVAECISHTTMPNCNPMAVAAAK
jgi:hypothetical protein